MIKQITLAMFLGVERDIFVQLMVEDVEIILLLICRNWELCIINKSGIVKLIHTESYLKVKFKSIEVEIILRIRFYNYL